MLQKERALVSTRYQGFAALHNPADTFAWVRAAEAIAVETKSRRITRVVVAEKAAKNRERGRSESEESQAAPKWDRSWETTAWGPPAASSSWSEGWMGVGQSGGGWARSSWDEKT